MKKINLKAVPTKKILLWGGVFLTVGVSGYLVYRAYKKWKQNQDDKLKALEDQIATIPKGGGSSTGSTGSGSITTPPELNTIEKIKAFQDFLDKQPNPNWVKISGKWQPLNKGVGYGSFGQYTKLQWDIPAVREAFLKTQTATSNPTNEIPTSKKENLVVIKKFTGASDTLMKSYATYSDGFLQAWANAILNDSKRNAFIYGNQIYLLTSPKKIYDKNPIGKVVTTTKSVYLRTEPKLDLNALQLWSLGANKKVGKVTTFYYNTTDKILYLYIPVNEIADDMDIFKWITANSVTF